jgi:hypothetical protein
MNANEMMAAIRVKVVIDRYPPGTRFLPYVPDARQKAMDGLMVQPKSQVSDNAILEIAISDSIQKIVKLIPFHHFCPQKKMLLCDQKKQHCLQSGRGTIAAVQQLE